MQSSRLLSILLRLQTDGRVTAQALAESFEVSVRTIYRDIDALGVAGEGRVGAAPGSQALNGSFVPVSRRAPAG